VITGLHHTLLSCPPGAEEELREFYVGLLGMAEIAKPPALAARGGAWFRSGTAELHLGVEEPFRPARKAHPGLIVDDLDAVMQQLAASGAKVEEDELFPGFRRIYTADPVGNRIELLQPR